MTAERILLIGRSSWELFAPSLARALEGFGLSAEVGVCGFDRELRLWSGEDAEFSARPPRVAVVFPEARELFSGDASPAEEEEAARARGSDAAAHLERAVLTLSAVRPGVSWVLSTAERAFPAATAGINDSETDPEEAALQAFNARLRSACREHGGWSLFERQRATLSLGTRSAYDARMDHLARMPLSEQGMRALAERLSAHLSAVLGRTKKVLALDCDNTLWGGVVGEDGVNGVRLGGDGIGRAYREFQRIVAALERRGVLVALCSRNNRQDVEAVLEGRPEMLLKPDRICASHIGWGPKPPGLRELSARLGLGLDGFVFVDDDPVEREEVRRALPEVSVPEFPADPAELPAFAEELSWRYFYRVGVGPEDRARTGLYRAKTRVEEAAEGFESPDDFLKSLDMQAVVSVNDAALVARSAQLSQKTNQFNLTLKRYTEAQIEAFLADGTHVLAAASLKDRFADHSWVALAIFERKPAWWELDSFMLSCRVIGRRFETFFLLSCLGHLRGLAAMPTRASFVPGPRNGLARDFLPAAGFRLLEEGADGVRRFELAGDPPAPVRDVFRVDWRTSS